MKDKFVSLPLSLSFNSNHGQKALFFPHIQIVTYVCCTRIWTSSPRKKKQSLFLTAHDRCEINLNNDVLSSTLVFFSFFFSYFIQPPKKVILRKKNYNILIGLLLLFFSFSHIVSLSYLWMISLLLFFLIYIKKKERKGKIYRNKDIK